MAARVKLLWVQVGDNKDMYALANLHSIIWGGQPFILSTGTSLMTKSHPS